MNDLLEVVYFAISPQASLDDYYATTSRLTPFLHSEVWTGSVSGFYVSADGSVFRLSYFTQDPPRSAAVLREFRARTQLLEPMEARSHPDHRFEKDYGGAELGFRQYLCSYTRIGLDLLEGDRTLSQRLFGTLRWEVLPSGGDARSHLEPSFLRLSSAYESTPPLKRDAFWEAFGFRKPGCTPWDHMFVNMIIGFDCLVQHPLSRDDINSGLAARDIGFSIPADWRPDQKAVSHPTSASGRRPLA